MVPVKRVPLRKCLGCNEMKPKKELIRLVRTPLGGIELDFKGKTAGRGAYVCPKADCFSKAQKTRRFEKALSGQIAQEIYNRLEEELKTYGEQGS